MFLHKPFHHPMVRRLRLQAYPAHMAPLEQDEAQVGVFKSPENARIMITKRMEAGATLIILGVIDR